MDEHGVPPGPIPRVEREGQNSARRVDAHHHLWQYSPEAFGWLEGELAGLRRDFMPEEFAGEMRSANVSGAVAVQARQSVEETVWLLELAATHPEILGVVGWLPIASPDFATALGTFAGETKLKGLRHVVQAEPAGFLDGTNFNRGMQSLSGSGLVYDLLVHESQMAEAIRFVDRHPKQEFVLDHLAKPRIAAGELEPWARQLRELALRPNMSCKLSGMVTEARADWTGDDLQPYFEVALSAFTPDRLMVGTDWPVLTPRCTYSRWWNIVEEWTGQLSVDEQKAVQGGNAIRVYHLD